MPERLYYEDSFLTRFPGTVTDIRERSRAAGQSVWQLALDRTAFYPTGGGQPCDTGTLRATTLSGVAIEIPVFAVEEDDAGEIWHLVAKPLPVGTPLEGSVEWSRRFDHMQQHSGQHLLSAVFLRELGAQTTSFHLGDESSTIDLERETLSLDDLERAELGVNRAVMQCIPVQQRVVSAREAQQLLADGKLRKLPARDGDVRLIEISGIELNACGGTHVRNTGEIGPVLLRSTERVRNTTRVSFVCGERAVRAAHADHLLLSRSAGLLSSSGAEVPDAVIRVQEESRRARKELVRWKEELVDYHVARLLVEEPSHHGRRLIRRIFSDRDAAYIKLLASRLTATAPQTVVLLASTLETPATVIAASSADVDLDCSARLRDAVAVHGGQGGGSPTMAQGQVPAAAVGGVFDAMAVPSRPAA